MKPAASIALHRALEHVEESRDCADDILNLVERKRDLDITTLDIQSLMETSARAQQQLIAADLQLLRAFAFVMADKEKPNV